VPDNKLSYGDNHRAEVGVLMTMAELTRGVFDAVNHGGNYSPEATGQQFPRIQAITVVELRQERRPKMPLTILPYVQVQRRRVRTQDESLFDF